MLKFVGFAETTYFCNKNKETMYLKPNAKINLGLNVVERRPDGYHNLETVFYPIPLFDELTVTASNNTEPYELLMPGNEIEGDAEHNLVIKALRLLQKEGYTIPSVKIELNKMIPSGAGMGGGSADAGFMLRALNDEFKLGIGNAKLEEYAARLGADCAIFIENKPVYAEGIGNIFTPIDLSLKGYWLVVIKPDIFISTAKAYSMITPKHPEKNLKEIIQLPVSEWRKWMLNDFEDSVFPQFPRLAELKEKLYECGAIYAAMSGSGSSLFGIFSTEQHLKATFSDCFYACLEL